MSTEGGMSWRGIVMLIIISIFVYGAFMYWDNLYYRGIMLLCWCWVTLENYGNYRWLN